MKITDWGAFLTGLAKAVTKAAVDYRANVARPPAAPLGWDDLAVKLRTLEGRLPVLIAWANANPGEFTAADDMLEFFEAYNLPGASTVKALIDATPGGLTDAEKWLPTVLWGLTLTDPAPQPMGGGDSPVSGRR
jgi:hypothetical protein